MENDKSPDLWYFYLWCTMDILRISQICLDSSDTISFLRQRNLLVKEHYCCDELCTQVKSKSSDGCEWHCKRCNSRFTIRIKSFFYNVHISLSVLIMLTYLFACKASVSFVQTTLKHKNWEKIHYTMVPIFMWSHVGLFTKTSHKFGWYRKYSCNWWKCDWKEKKNTTGDIFEDLEISGYLAF